MSFNKRVDDARDAFRSKDKPAAQAAHEIKRIQDLGGRPPEDHAPENSQYIGDFVYGGLDGIITTFAVVSGVAGADLGTRVILILGIANLIADGFSMAAGAYISSKSEQELYDKERERERWEVDNFLEAEQEELREIYLSRGFTTDDANKLIEIYSRDEEHLVDAMMLEELGMVKDNLDPLKSALVTLGAFIIAGAVPLLIYFAGLLMPIPANSSFPISIFLSGLALFGLGAAKVVITHDSALKRGIEMLLIGALAASVAYGIGLLLKGIGL